MSNASLPESGTAQDDTRAPGGSLGVASPDRLPAPRASRPGTPACGPTAQPAFEPAAPRRHSRRRVLLGSGTLLGAGAVSTALWALNRFVIDHVEVDDVAAYEAANSSVSSTSSATAATDVAVTDNSYTSSLTSIGIEQVTTGSGDDTVTYYVADVRVSDATALRSAFANNAYGTNITAVPSTMATEHGAVLAINGDYYGFRSDGILIRNGVVYRDEGVRDGMAFYTDGRVEVYDETSTDAGALLAAGVWNTLSFGPALVQGGAVLAGIDAVEVDTNVGNHSIQGTQPRTALGAVADGHYVVVVVDGRDQGYSRGVTMTELAQIMAGLGCDCAYNLDGGGSSTLWFNGQVVNRPSNGGERETSDILYIAQGA
ncbi:phosphodiester glycosidase family protein [Actinomyces sp. 594]|uniref:phosphodiester glycosidase family protein n=1 Tax=Actinomyces sp. 594 TaxID=2057793 RepID=UPI001C592AFF|nr:phosphodiester glycosidase family protein [Actinomyces sp. 594]MBW3068049.1 phosphodiester glycosidase family protein [Actinomyces sp. 594]